MKGALKFASILASAALASASTLWSGSFDYYSTVADFDTWSWSNQVGEYQWYIHGTLPTSNYLALSSSYHNPAITTENTGLKLTVNKNAIWNSQTFWRTELIPQTSTNIGTGHLYYHFSLKRTDVNPPQSTYEHQVLFFESHFTEFKYGVGSDPTKLQWFVSGSSQWSTTFAADTWYNFAYDIDFAAGTVGLWASTGGAALTKVVNNIAATTYTNSADWHLGVLAFGSGDVSEDWYFSGVYIEDGTITTAIGSGSTVTSSTSVKPTTSSTSVSSVKPTTSSTSVSSSTSTKPTTTPITSTTVTTKSSTTATTTTSASTATQTQYGQCGGISYTGPTVCASPFTCTVLNPYYSQCL